MAAKPLHCQIRNAVPLRVGDHGVNFNSGCKIIDCSFPNVLHPEVGEIHFKNYYTGLLSIKVKFRSKEHGAQDCSDVIENVGTLKWQKCVRELKLMPDPHCETSAQDNVVITRKDLPFDLVDVSAIRLILQQPSPVWKEFNIEDLKFYKHSKEESRVLPLPAWLTENAGQKKDRKPLEGVPDMGKLSARVQELWSLSEQVSSQQTKAALGRYDIDGCYEINLLSYT